MSHVCVAHIHYITLTFKRASSQFRTILYKLLQWKAAATFHPAHTEVRAGRVRSWGNRGNHVSHWPYCIKSLIALKGKFMLWKCQFCPVGASSVLQQQDHLWPGWGETQRDHIHTGVYVGLESVHLDWKYRLPMLKFDRVQDEECLRPGEATDLTFLERLEDKMGNHPHFVTWVQM